MEDGTADLSGAVSVLSAGNPEIRAKGEKYAGYPASAKQTHAGREPLKAAITFDDGPHSVCTPKLLDGLKERGVKATFLSWGRTFRERKKFCEECWGKAI